MRTVDSLTAVDKLTSGHVSGPNSQSLKYDLLTALLVTAGHGEPTKARLAMRLSLVVTARYSWRRKIFAVGQRELARMWGVTERTAKREIAKMRAYDWIRVERHAARGRVAEHSINMGSLLQDTMPYWGAVGPDFEARMTGAQQAPASNVVPLRADNVPTPADDGTVWPEIAAKLQSQDAAVYGAWMAQLSAVDTLNGVLTLMAPSAFVAQFIRTHYMTRLLAASVQSDPTIREVQVIDPDTP